MDDAARAGQDGRHTMNSAGALRSVKRTPLTPAGEGARALAIARCLDRTATPGKPRRASSAARERDTPRAMVAVRKGSQRVLSLAPRGPVSSGQARGRRSRERRPGHA